MQIEIRKIIKPLEMSGYAPEMEGQKLFVWVNPTMAKIRAYDELTVKLRARLPSSSRNSEPSDSISGENIPVEETKKGKQSFEEDGVKLDIQLREWYAELLSQGPAGTECSADELQQLAEIDPACITWVTQGCWQLINKHRNAFKKA